MEAIIFDYDAYQVEADGSETLLETTNAETAKAGEIFDEQKEYSPLAAVTGCKLLTDALEDILGSCGDKFDSIAIRPYGERKPQDKKVMPIRDFQKAHKTKEPPIIGEEYNIEGRGAICTQRSKNRAVFDYNLPLAGKDLRYKGTVISRCTEGLDFVRGVMKAHYSEPDAVYEEDGFITIRLPDMCKYDAMWQTVMKWKVQGTLRKAGYDKVRFVEQYVKRDSEPDDKEQESS